MICGFSTHLHIYERHFFIWKKFTKIRIKLINLPYFGFILIFFTTLQFKDVVRADEMFRLTGNRSKNKQVDEVLIVQVVKKLGSRYGEWSAEAENN